jgi:hypothetical protein
MVKNYTDKQLLDQVKALPDFNGYPKNIWILGVRSNEDQPNLFDDKFYIFKNKTFIMVMSGTTNPGVSILKKFEKYNSNGAAIPKANNWYYDIWKYGFHRGRIPALLQRGRKISVYRDNNKNEKSEETGKLYAGYYGINFHLNGYDLKSKIKKMFINSWSAGCQVTNDVTKYNVLMDRCKKEKSNISYCLIKEF